MFYYLIIICLYYDILQNVCQIALTVKCTTYTQKAACNTFMILIKLCKDIQLAETVEQFNRFNIYNIKGENWI